jgi:hypothetical protein
VESSGDAPPLSFGSAPDRTNDPIGLLHNGLPISPKKSYPPEGRHFPQFSKWGEGQAGGVS